MDVRANGGALQTREGQHNDFHPWIVSPAQPSPAAAQPSPAAARQENSAGKFLVVDKKMLEKLFSSGVLTWRRGQAGAVSRRRFSQCPEMAPTRAFSLLKTPTSAFTIKNLRHYAELPYKHSE